MSRIVTYCVNEHPFYCRMAAVSIRMLREENAHIPIRVFLVQDERRKTVFKEGMTPIELSTTEFAGVCSVMGAEVHPIPAIEDDCDFGAHKHYLYECAEESVLCLDADTFIFGDVEFLFDRYKDVDVAATRPGLPDEELFFSTYNPGVVLWNNGWATSWAKEIHQVMSNDLVPESIALNRFIAKKGLNHDVFEPGDCCTLVQEGDLQKISKGILFHSRTRYWQQVHSSMFGLPSKMNHRYLPRPF